MEGTLMEKRRNFRLHYATLIRAVGAATWLLHFSVIVMLCTDPHLELEASKLSKSEIVLHGTLIEYRAKRVYFIAAEHVVILWNLIYSIGMGPNGQNRIFAYMWMHYNWTAVPLLSLVIVVVEFASQDMSYYIVIDDCHAEEAVIAVSYFLIGFNAYLLAYNQLRMLQQQVTRPFKPGWVLQRRGASADSGAAAVAAMAAPTGSSPSSTGGASAAQLLDRRQGRTSLSTDRLLDLGMVDVAALASIAAFYLIILAIGLVAARKNNKAAASKTEEAIVAGRNIGITVGVFTCTATWVGGGYINGTAESVFVPGQGLVWTQAPAAYAASLLVGGLLFARRMRARRYVTMLDPLQAAFGDRMCALLFLPCLLGELFWSAAILAALGGTVSIIVSFSMNWSIVISAGIAVLYTLFGGLYSVAYTDVAQLIFIFVGLWTVVPFALSNHAVSPLASSAFLRQTANSSSVGWLGNLQPEDRWRYGDSALMLVLGGVPWQVYFQRVLSQRTAAGAVAISAASGLAVLLMALPPVLIGAAAASASNSSQWLVDGIDSRFILPLAMQNLCPRPVAIIGLGAVSAAVMSSADSTVLSSSSMFCRNVFRPLVWPGATEDKLLWVMRGSILAAGAASAGLAISIKTIYGLWFLCSDLVYVVVLPQLTAAVYMPWANAGGSLAGYLVSLAMRLTAGESLLGLPALIRWPGYQSLPEDGSFVQQFPIRTVSMLSGSVALIAVSLLSAKPGGGSGGEADEAGGSGTKPQARFKVSKETLTTYM